MYYTMIPTASIVGVLFGFVFAARFVFGPLRSMPRLPLLWLLGPLLALFGVLMLFAGGLLMSFHSPACGIAFAVMAFCWIVGGNIIFKQLGLYRSAPRD